MEKREVELELMKAKSALHKMAVQCSISQNRVSSVWHKKGNLSSTLSQPRLFQSVDIPDVTVERIDEGCDAKPESFTEGVQTDDVSSAGGAYNHRCKTRFTSSRHLNLSRCRRRCGVCWGLDHHMYSESEFGISLPYYYLITLLELLAACFFHCYLAHLIEVHL